MLLTSLEDMRQLDASLRTELQQTTQRKVSVNYRCFKRVFRLLMRDQNAYTETYMTALRKTSVLNDNVVQLPPTLSSLQASLRTKTSFSHIQRLHNMLYAYGATVIEVVRRKEFGRLENKPIKANYLPFTAEFFYHRASSVLEVMAKLS